MMRSLHVPAVVCLAGLVLLANRAQAQPLGTFRWQLQPFCNVITVNVTQNGAIYTLDGHDDQCGAAQRAPLVGAAALNPDGSIGFGLHVVTVPGGMPVSIDARISLASLSGTWSDSAGNAGAFAFGAASGGTPRPAPSQGTGGDITGVTAGTGLVGGGTTGDVTVAVDRSIVQQRITEVCRAGEAVRQVNQDGSVVCERINAGDITAVTAGTGLAGGGTAGAVTLTAIFGGDGAVDASARADHEHVSAGSALSVAVGPAALAVNTGPGNVGIGANALAATTNGAHNVAVGLDALAVNTGGSANVAIGRGALAATVQGGFSVAVGDQALMSQTFSLLNTAVGARAAEALTEGGQNTVVGTAALLGATDIDNVVAVGAGTGGAVTTGAGLTLIGTSASASNGLVNAAAIGVNASVTQSNSLVLGNNASVGIGTSAPLDRLHVVGTIRVGTGTVGCVVDADATVIAGTCPSDARLKRDVTPFEPVLDRIAGLQPVNYFWRVDEFPDRHFGARPSYGLIAQDAEAVFPDLVTTDEDGYKAVNYTKLPLIAIQAIRELTDRNQSLKQELVAMRRRLDALEAAAVRGRQ